MTSNDTNNKIEFDEISAENNEGLTEITSFCVNCESDGVTKFLFVKIPFYREVIISSFSCPECNYSNNEIQSAGKIQEKGIKIKLNVECEKDLNRQVIKTDTASVRIPELDFEIPPSSQKGCLSTVEGVLQRSIDGLKQEQPVRRAMQPEVAEKIDIFINKLSTLLKPNTHFTLILDDPSGNGFVENPHAPSNDPNLTYAYYKRSLEQNQQLGLVEGEQNESDEIQLPQTTEELDLQNEVVTFNTMCSNCNAPNITNMKLVKIPFFKEVIIMATNCDSCGNRSNEVKSGTGFSPRGKKITLNFTCEEDLRRDVLKSETCAIEIPELELETGGMAMSGKFTTVEGLLVDLKHLLVTSNPFVGGDSSTSAKLIAVGDKLQKYVSGSERFTLILDDPNSNSYVENLNAPDDDPNLSEIEYERTFEQNEELGLNDMKTDNY